MGDKSAKHQESARAGRVWIAPRHSLKGPAGERAWEHRPGGPPSSSRYLELADIALGVKKPAPHRRKTQAVTHDMGSKTEPYVR
jgi:hypothetical protein